MDVLQAWLLIAIPTLSLGLLLFIGRSSVRSLVGYLVLALGFGLMAAFHRPSGALFGGLLALLYATGRGGSMERQPDRPDRVGIPDVVKKDGRPRPV